ncbi:PTS lactose/cellobiose transporter subunit IIA [Enterococcus faecalis]|jgi:Phosphotransferase system cellobiose-specific component IIA|uniref:PTS lactose/cellobiose transporter subunit IIA n=1 Tax=Enterococcus TaxID=1350 RepID=UPI00080C659D|nr:PTS lactose/cellobiose transporter subunit IIA [Enterococcus faecalis]ANU71612.1 PTS lactose/cellobiose transporter subunit IIA [Enterococcus faecalis]ARV02482.1 PTS mannose transporter subunit IIA [Enterococcus faecalis]ASU26370.1 PTS lactose/cellobiose transporter subunit IIA [Enterococcus faecalis]EGO8197341.1 PTS lactose/cellobiose transporter subunit IIA [Enterococcus faecalis]MBG9436533.1 PTS lactose/cellobiose transporter subunit IIA [Enterococcus faecalis]
MNEKIMQAVMGLIMYGGDAKSSAMEAIQFAKQYEFEQAEAKLKAANESLTLAHNSQTDMLVSEAQGEKNAITLLMVHSQDHLMTSITFTDLAKEIVDLYKVMQPK